MTQPKTKQHYIPRCYLEAFADPTLKGAPRVWVYQIKTGRIFKTNPTNILIEKDMYTIPLPSGGRNLIIEDTLANIEGRYVDIFRSKIDQNKPLTPEERGLFAIFVTAMLTRTKSRKDQLLSFIKDVDDRAQDLERAHNVKTKTNFRKQLEALTPTIHQLTMASNLAELSDLVYQMKYAILTPVSDADRFVTSDNPCHLINPELIKAYGFGHMNSSPGLGQKSVELTLTLSPTKALSAGWLLQQEMYLPVDSKMVEQINWRSTRHAQDFLVSSQEEALLQIKNRVSTKPKK